jgi:hypothetical protein
VSILLRIDDKYNSLTSSSAVILVDVGYQLQSILSIEGSFVASLSRVDIVFTRGVGFDT